MYVSGAVVTELVTIQKIPLKITFLRLQSLEKWWHVTLSFSQIKIAVG